MSWRHDSNMKMMTVRKAKLCFNFAGSLADPLGILGHCSIWELPVAASHTHDHISCRSQFSSPRSFLLDFSSLQFYYVLSNVLLWTLALALALALGSSADSWAFVGSIVAADIIIMLQRRSDAAVVGGNSIKSKK